jgi:hypothetical protein
MSILTNLQRRLDQTALEQARAEVVRLAERVEELERDLEYTRNDADAWYEHANDLRACMGDTVSVGITQAGQLIVGVA